MKTSSPALPPPRGCRGFRTPRASAPGPRSRPQTVPPRGLAWGRDSWALCAARRAGRPRPSALGRRTGVGRAPRAAPRSARPGARAAIVSAPRHRAGLGDGAASLSHSRSRSFPARWPRAADPHRTYLQQQLLDAVLAGGLAASGGGGASGPSDHLWKRRGGGCLLVQLQPTSSNYFGAAAAPRLRPNSPPPGLGAGPLAGTLGAEAGWAGSRPQPLGGGAPRSRWDGFLEVTVGAASFLLSWLSFCYAHAHTPSIFSLDNL